MRAYFFVNYYVGGIRAGIQAGHAMDQMWLRYVDGGPRERLDTLREFSQNHKTFILLHAGDHAELADLAKLFASDENPYPWAQFSEPGLNDALTCVAIVIPERLYDDASTEAAQSADAVGYSAWELDFLRKRIECRVAI